jgi:hypothetical protein
LATYQSARFADNKFDTIKYFLLGSHGEIDSFRLIEQYTIYGDLAPEEVLNDTTIVSYYIDGLMKHDTIYSKKINSTWYMNIHGVQSQAGVFEIKQKGDTSFLDINNGTCSYPYLIYSKKDTSNFCNIYSYSSCRPNFFMFYTGIDSVIRINNSTRNVSIFIGSSYLSNLRNYPQSLNAPRSYIQVLYIDKELKIPIRTETYLEAFGGEPFMVSDQIVSLDFFERSQYDMNYRKLLIDSLPDTIGPHNQKLIKMNIHGAR